MDTYDVIVIGGGSAGEHCAGALSDGGLSVAIVEPELVGGECSYWACMPSKGLLRPGEVIEAARRVPGAREAVDGDMDVSEALKLRDKIVSGYSDAGQAKWLDGKGIDLLRGTGRIAGPGKVTVEGQTYGTRHIVVATGSDPVIPPVPGLRELDGIWTNREATGLKEVPRRLLVLGGGPVGVEMAQAVKRLGASVALVEGEQHVLPREPHRLGEALGEVLDSEGIELRLGEKVSGASRHGDDFVLSFDGGGDLRGDRLLVATGRRPRVTDIGLESVGVEERAEGIEVDSRMSAADGVWAIGDVTGIWPLTYVGKYQGRVAAANILGRDVETNYDAVPRVVFTDPQAASVGESEGKEATVELSDNPRTNTYARYPGKAPGFMTLVSDGERLIGAYALGPEAGEWLQQATLAVRAGVPLEVLHDTIQPFPTFSEGFLHALLALRAKAPATD